MDGNPVEITELPTLCAAGKVTFIYVANDQDWNSALVLQDYLADG